MYYDVAAQAVKQKPIKSSKQQPHAVAKGKVEQNQLWFKYLVAA